MGPAPLDTRREFLIEKGTGKTKLTGETPRNFIRTYRLKRGAELLRTKSGNVGDVAFEVGFTSTSYFIKCFKEKFHQLPSRFQTSD